jgi:hypothetical protein
MLKNDIYIGSVKDTDDVWHPVVSSPSEDIVANYIERLISAIDTEDGEEGKNNFWSDDYTIELLPMIMEDILEVEEEWNNQWESYSLEDEDWEAMGVE